MFCVSTKESDHGGIKQAYHLDISGYRPIVWFSRYYDIEILRTALREISIDMSIEIGETNPCTVGHKSHDPSFHAFLRGKGVMTFAAHCRHARITIILETGTVMPISDGPNLVTLSCKLMCVRNIA